MLAILLIICARSVILSETKDLLFRRFFRFARAQRMTDVLAKTSAFGGHVGIQTDELHQFEGVARSGDPRMEFVIEGHRRPGRIG